MPNFALLRVPNVSVFRIVIRKNWTIKNTTNAFCWYCCFRSGFSLQVKRLSSLPTIHHLLRRRALLRLQVMLLRDFFFNLNLKNNEYLHSTPTPRITAQISQILLFSTPFFIQKLWWLRRYTCHYPSEEKENLHHVRYLPHSDAWEKGLCSAGKGTFFLTDSSQPVTDLREVEEVKWRL